MDKRWTLAIITILMVLIVYTFLARVLKKDRNQSKHTRIYRDYTDYGRKKNNYDSLDHKTYASSAEARKIKRSIFVNLSKDTSSSYDYFMSKALRTPINLPKPNSNPHYEETIKLAHKPLPEMQSGLIYYQQGDYYSAFSKFEEAVNKLESTELVNRIQLYGLMAECCLKLKNDNGYIDYKIKNIRMKRKYNKLLMEAYPQYRNNNKFNEMELSTQEATKNLLRVKSAASKLQDSPSTREMVKKAELDLQVARKIAL